MKDSAVPVFRPTWEEFKNFSEYVESIEEKCKKFGLCKIVPPPEFIARADGYYFEDIGFVGDKPRCDQKRVNELKRRRGKKIPVKDEVIIHSPVKQEVYGSRGVYEVICIEDSEYISVSEFKNKCHERLQNSSKRERENFEKQNFSELERSFWSNIGTRSAPLYGADSPGTLFDKTQEVWNCTKLGTMLDLIAENLPGVTRPMLYFGMWKSMFPWHVEDMNLFSINYLHFGKPKQWYAIPGSHFEKVERVLKNLYPHQARQCPEFLRHKKCVVTPQILKKHNIPVLKCVQEEGEFMITFPKSFHSGFNYGFNCAESVNFALKSWVLEGCVARYCECVSHSVKIDMQNFLQRARERKIIKDSDPVFAAADAIHEEERKRIERASKPIKRVIPWSCPACTFINRRSGKQCAVCGHKLTPKQIKASQQKAKDLENGKEDSSSQTSSSISIPSAKIVNDDEKKLEQGNDSDSTEIGSSSSDVQNMKKKGIYDEDNYSESENSSYVDEEFASNTYESSRQNSLVSRKRPRDTSANTPSCIRQKVSRKHEVVQFFRGLGVGRHYAERVIENGTSIDQLLDMSHNEMFQLLPVGVRVRVRQKGPRVREILRNFCQSKQ